MQKDCESECKFCIIHKYGVFILGGGSVLIIILILVYFWRYICCCCCKKPTQVPDEPAKVDNNPGDSQPVQSIASQQFINALPTLHEKSPSSQQSGVEPTKLKTHRDHPTVIDQTQKRASPVPGQSPNYIPPPMSFNSPSALVIQPEPQQPFPQQLPPDFSNLPFSPQATSIRNKTKTKHLSTKTKGFQATAPIQTPPPIYTTTGPAEQQKRSKPMIPVEPVATPDPFKLPQPMPTSKESTGSNYFKQMFQGRKAVASISQYNNLRKKTKKHKTHKDKTKTKDRR